VKIEKSEGQEVERKGNKLINQQRKRKKLGEKRETATSQSAL